MKRGLILAGVFAFAFAGLAGTEWRNLDEAHQLGGRKTSAGYLQGKVVLVCREGASLPRMENIWQSFKTKEFVLLGTVAAESRSLTFPRYRDAGLVEAEPAAPFYVVAADGRLAYHGADDRAAVQAVVTALTDLDAPRSVRQWQSFLEFELETLPAHAYLRYPEFAKEFPEPARAYETRARALSEIPDIRRAAELVSFARKAKDMRAFDRKAGAQKQKFSLTVRQALRKYAALKDHANPLVAQEAKNALADLTWTLAAL